MPRLHQAWLGKKDSLWSQISAEVPCGPGSLHLSFRRLLTSLVPPLSPKVLKLASACGLSHVHPPHPPPPICHEQPHPPSPTRPQRLFLWLLNPLAHSMPSPCTAARAQITLSFSCLQCQSHTLQPVSHTEASMVCHQYPSSLSPSQRHLLPSDLGGTTGPGVSSTSP